MKTIILALCILFTLICYSQTTSKYNSLMDRYEFYNSRGVIIGYAEYNSLQERWEYYDSNYEMYAYSVYNSLTGETEYTEVRKNKNPYQNNSRYNYDIYSDFDDNLVMFAKYYQQGNYKKANEIFYKLTPSQKDIVAKYASIVRRKRGGSKNYVKLRREEVDLYKHTINFKVVFDDFKRREIAYQLRIKNKSRLELLGGIGSFDSFNTYKLLLNYQWLDNLFGSFNYYGGLGVGMENFKDSANLPFDDISGTYILGYGVFGVEYNFNIPLLLFIDYDINYSNDLSSGFGIGLRYGFGF